MNINAILISTTNFQFTCYIGEEGELTFSDNGYAYFKTKECRYRFAFRTSYILKYEYNEEELTIQTLNSIYKFKIIGNIQKPSTVTLSSCKKQILSYTDSVKAHTFSCISIDGFIGFIKFQEKLSRLEALDKISEKPHFDSNGNLVVNIHVPQEKDMFYGLKIEQKDTKRYICISEFEKIGLSSECIMQFISNKKIYEYDGKKYIKIDDVKDFFTV